MIELVELQRRAKELDGRRQAIDEQLQTLTQQRDALAKDNHLRQRIGGFAETVIAALDDLNFTDRQKLLRLIIEEVRVTGWEVDIRLRIPLDEPPPTKLPAPSPPKGRGRPRPLSSQDRLRSLGEPQSRQLPAQRTRPGPHTRQRPDLTQNRLPRCPRSLWPDRPWIPAPPKETPIDH